MERRLVVRVRTMIMIQLTKWNGGSCWNGNHDCDSIGQMERRFKLEWRPWLWFDFRSDEEDTPAGDLSTIGRTLSISVLPNIYWYNKCTCPSGAERHQIISKIDNSVVFVISNCRNESLIMKMNLTEDITVFVISNFKNENEKLNSV